MGLLWQLADLNGVVIKTIRDRRLGKVNIFRNGGRLAQITVSLDDPVVVDVLPLARLLKVKLDGRLIFKGRIVEPTSADEAGAGEAGASQVLNAIDASFHLQECYLPAYGPTSADQSAIMQAQLTAVAGNGHGVVAGDQPATVTRTRQYFDGKECWEALVQMSEVINGPDFELEPVDDGSATIARLNTFAHQGSDLSNKLKFDYGHGRHNVAGFAYTPSGSAVCNKFTAVGATLPDGTAPAAIVTCPSSIAFYGGTFERFETYSDVSELTTLTAKAQEYVSRYAFAIEFVDITTPNQGDSADPDLVDFTGSAYGLPPKFGADYWLGDTIAARIRRGVDVTVRGRVDAVEINETEQGAVQVKTTCSPVALTTADLSSTTATKTVDGQATSVDP